MKPRKRVVSSNAETASSTVHSSPFAVIDVETTGFSPLRGDRIIEVAIVRVAPDGSTEDEYTTLVNPLRDVGATYIHGITDEDVAEAPLFSEIAGDILERLRGAVLVAHNVRFDHDFLAAEFSNAGILLPAVPELCTLQLACRLHPFLSSHKLVACGKAAGMHVERSHMALDDARLCQRLLTTFLKQAEAQGVTTLEALGCAPLSFPFDLWPSLPASGRRVVRAGLPGAVGDLPFLARVVASVEATPVPNARIAPYLDLLDRVLEDRVVTEAEAGSLAAIAKQWGLHREEVITAHESYLESLVVAALADGTVTEGERRDLEAVTRLLAVDPSVLHAMMDRLATEWAQDGQLSQDVRGDPERASVRAAMDLEDAERSIREALAPFPPKTRRAMLRVLTAPEAERAAAIGALYEATDGGEAAELLIDLEDDRTLALIVADVLKDSPGGRRSV